MKKIRLIKNGIGWSVAVLFVAFNFSCKKLIQIPLIPSGKIPTEQLFADSAGILSAVKGIYYNFNETTAAHTNLVSGLIGNVTGRSGDELTYISASDLDNNAVLVDNSQVATLWSTAYSNLYQMNSCLEHITSTTVISQSLRNQLIGEVKVTRALYYFNLVNLFGGVPLVTTTDFHINQSLPRASVDAIYDQIILDLTDAQKLLTPAYPVPNTTPKARPNLYVADALLAKVYLYRQQWANAASTASLVINSGVYSLTPLAGVFLDGSQEAIWQLPVAKNGINQTPDGASFVPAFSFLTPNYQIASPLFNAFETGDLRKINWISSSTIGGKTYFFPYKYKNTSLVSTPVEDFMFLRLGEQYLIRAEANAHLNNTSDAIADLNLIRNPTRVGLPNYAGTTDQISVLNAIMHERQVELFCEWGNRWYDLKRTGTIDAVLGAEKNTWQPYAALFPIPLIEMQSNPFLVQNPGYH